MQVREHSAEVPMTKNVYKVARISQTKIYYTNKNTDESSVRPSENAEVSPLTRPLTAIRWSSRRQEAMALRFRHLQTSNDHVEHGKRDQDAL